ncbi:MAG: ComEC/Rec2 family competence protein [Flavobacteriales bacterium]
MNWGVKPFVRLLPPFIIGIVLGIFIPYTPIVIAACFYVFLLLLLVLWFTPVFANYRWRYVFGIVINFALIFGGWQLTVNKNQSATLGAVAKEGKAIVAEIIKEPKKKANKVVIEVAVRAVKTPDSWETTQGNVLLSLPTDENSFALEKGDIIAFTPSIKEVKSTANPGQFDYAQYLQFHLIKSQGFLRSYNWTLLEKSSSGIWNWATEIRKYGIQKLDKTLKPKEAAVAEALIFGYKNNLDAETQQAFSSSGAMHVLAVSGLHVGIIFMLCGLIFKPFKGSKYFWIATIITLFIIWGYAMVTGLSPSVMRASTMFTFMAVGKNLNRHTNIYNSIAASAFLLLLINPYIITETGFQLSYFAVIGIVWLQPMINAWYHSGKKILDKLWELTSVSIAAQTATFPLGMLYFNMFPNYFLLSNLIVIPAAFTILISGLAFVGFSEIPYLGDWLGVLLQYEVSALNMAVSYIEQMPNAISVWVISAFEAVLIYVVFIQLIRWLKTPSGKKLALCLSLVVVLCCSFSFRKFKNDTQREIVVYNVPYHSAFSFIQGRSQILITSLNPKEDDKSIRYNLKPHWLQAGLNGEKYISTKKLKRENTLINLYKSFDQNLLIRRNYFHFHGKDVAYVNSQTKLAQSKQKFSPHLLIVSGRPNLTPAQLIHLFSPQLVVCDSACSGVFAAEVEKLAHEKGIPFHNVKEQGALKINCK